MNAKPKFPNCSVRERAKSIVKIRSPRDHGHEWQKNLILKTLQNHRLAHANCDLMRVIIPSNHVRSKMKNQSPKDHGHEQLKIIILKTVAKRQTGVRK